MLVTESLLNRHPLHRATDNLCRFCRKIFCCTKCRDRHVNKVHPDLNANCSLCASKKLPMRQFEFEKLCWENKELLAHIADKHLPLRCVLCENLFETVEDLKSIGACKWYSEKRQVLFSESLPGTPVPTSFEIKLKRTLSDIRHNNHAFFTPPEIYRNTSTPMFIGHKNNFEFQTPCVPNFSLKTPKTNSPSITHSNANSKIQQSYSDSNIKFFSFSPCTLTTEGTTPFKSSSSDEQFPRNNSGRKLDIKEANEDVRNEAEKTSSSYDDYITSPVSMNLTNVENQGHTPKFVNVGNSEESGKTSDVVKKVRFSDQHETLPEIGNQMEFCERNALNRTEEDDDIFHDAHDVSNAKKTKTASNMRNTENTRSTKDTEDIKEESTEEENTRKEEKRNKHAENTTDAADDRVDDHQDRNAIRIDSSDTRVNISQENKQNAERENRAEKLANGVSAIAQAGTSRVLMMVLVENNSTDLNTSLMPLINSGLKKLEEQIASPPLDMSEFPMATNPIGYRRSSTRLEINVSSVESSSNDNNNAKSKTDQQQVGADFPSSSTSGVESGPKSNNGGILSAVAQAVRLAFKNLSGVTSNSADSFQTVQQQIADDAMSLPETSASSNIRSNIGFRYGKRARDENDVSSWANPTSRSLDISSPLPKRKRGWYKIKGRRPIHSVRNTRQVTSPRGVSTETQVFSQGSLTVGDTVLPLPARAHPEVSVMSPE